MSSVMIRIRLHPRCRKPTKLLILLSLCLLCAPGVFGQGTVYFNNHVIVGFEMFEPVIAPVYGPEAGLGIHIRKTGNTINGTPAGTQTYNGALLAGTGFTAQLWGVGGVTSDMSDLLLTENGTTTFRTGGAAGYVQTPANPTIIPNAPAGPGSRATLQLRVWDNQGGTITSWPEAVARWQSGTIAIGYSDLFTPPYDLGDSLVTPPSLAGLTSFNLTQTPEPSCVTLVFIAGLCWCTAWRYRKKQNQQGV